MTTHMNFDPSLTDETVVEVREHWLGRFHFGAPDGIIVNTTKDLKNQKILDEQSNN